MDQQDPNIVVISWFLLGVSVGILVAMVWLGVFP